MIRRGLYHKRDGSPVEANQVQARVNNYGSMFEKDGPVIRLREESTMLSNAPQDFTIFRDDDEAFFEWLEEHPEGYFVNTERNPKPNYLVLHTPGCPHFTGTKSLHWTKDYVKVCSTRRSELEEWAINSRRRGHSVPELLRVAAPPGEITQVASLALVLAGAWSRRERHLRHGAPPRGSGICR